MSRAESISVLLFIAADIGKQYMPINTNHKTCFNKTRIEMMKKKNSSPASFCVKGLKPQTPDNKT